LKEKEEILKVNGKMEMDKPILLLKGIVTLSN